MSTKTDATTETENKNVTLAENAKESATKAAESVISAATKILEDAASKSREQYDTAVDVVTPRLKALKVPATASGAVDSYFDFATKVLETQRDFVTKLISEPEAKVEAATASVKGAAKSATKTASKAGTKASSTAKSATKTAAKKTTAKKATVKKAASKSSKASE